MDMCAHLKLCAEAEKLPSLSEATVYIVEAASACGAPHKQTKPRIPRDHPMVIALQALEAQRRMETNALMKLTMSRYIVKARRAVSQINATLRCDYASSKFRVGYNNIGLRQRCLGLQVLMVIWSGILLSNSKNKRVVRKIIWWLKCCLT